MAALSDQILLTRLQRATGFMREVRLAQAECGKKLKGRNRLTPEQQHAIRKAADESRLVAAAKEMTGDDSTVHDLFDRFEEMCRRRTFSVDADLRPALVNILAGELLANHRALDASVERMMSVTVHRGAIGPSLRTDPEFERFRDTPGIFSRAAVNNPSDPGAFLRKLGTSIDALAADPEFQRFRDTPGIFTRAAVGYPSDPCGFLRKLSTTIDTLAADKAFERFRETHSIFTHAAVGYPSDPGAFLRKVVRGSGSPAP